MALYDNRDELRCEKCGMNVFTEKSMYVYTKEKGRIKDVVTRTKVGDFLECTNPNCRHTIDKKSNSYFKNAEVVDKD